MGENSDKADKIVTFIMYGIVVVIYSAKFLDYLTDNRFSAQLNVKGLYWRDAIKKKWKDNEVFNRQKNLVIFDAIEIVEQPNGD